MIAFFPFNPRSARWSFWAGAFACAVLFAWALNSARLHQEHFAIIRAGVCAGLALAFAYGATRLRVRPGWGVALDEDALRLARPLSRGTLEIPWWAIANVRRDGDSRLVVFLKPDALEPPEGAPRPTETRVLLARHLFASEEVFQLLFQALKTRIPDQRLDA